MLEIGQRFRDTAGSPPLSSVSCFSSTSPMLRMASTPRVMTRSILLSCITAATTAAVYPDSSTRSPALRSSVPLKTAQAPPARMPSCSSMNCTQATAPNNVPWRRDGHHGHHPEHPHAHRLDAGAKFSVITFHPSAKRETEGRRWISTGKKPHENRHPQRRDPQRDDHAHHGEGSSVSERRLICSIDSTSGSTLVWSAPVLRR
jgi:hypothetical protein